MNIDIGIEAAKRQEIASGLSRVLADTYTLYLKTHNFHWNVTGPMFQTLHARRIFKMRAAFRCKQPTSGSGGR